MDLYNVKSAVFELDWEGAASPSALGNRKRWVIKIGDWRQAQGMRARACNPSTVGKRTDSWVCLSYIMRPCFQKRGGRDGTQVRKSLPSTGETLGL